MKTYYVVTMWQEKEDFGSKTVYNACFVNTDKSEYEVIDELLGEGKIVLVCKKIKG